MAYAAKPAAQEKFHRPRNHAASPFFTETGDTKGMQGTCRVHCTVPFFTRAYAYLGCRKTQRRSIQRCCATYNAACSHANATFGAILGIQMPLSGLARPLLRNITQPMRQKNSFRRSIMADATTDATSWQNGESR